MKFAYSPRFFYHGEGEYARNAVAIEVPWGVGILAKNHKYIKYITYKRIFDPNIRTNSNPILIRELLYRNIGK